MVNVLALMTSASTLDKNRLKLDHHDPSANDQGNGYLRPSEPPLPSSRKKQRTPPEQQQMPPPPASSDSAKSATSSAMSSEEKVLKLQRSLAFVKAEHERMLRALHEQIELLKRKNKELQLQLVMRGFNESQISSSPNSEVNIVQGSPEELATLESHLKQLKAQLHEARSRNVYLSNLLERQNGQIAELLQQQQQQEREEEEGLQLGAASAVSTVVSTPVPRSSPSDVTELEAGRSTALDTPTGDADADVDARPVQEYAAKLEEAEKLISQLRRENVQQKKELLEIRAKTDRSAKLRYKGCNHPGSNSPAKSRLLRMRPQRPARHSSLSRTADLRDMDPMGVAVGVTGHPAACTRAGSLDRFPPLKQRLSKWTAEAAAMTATLPHSPSIPPLGDQLPPVAGSSGSPGSDCSSSFSAASPRRSEVAGVVGGRQPLNLVTLNGSGLGSAGAGAGAGQQQQKQQQPASLPSLLTRRMSKGKKAKKAGNLCGDMGVAKEAPAKERRASQQRSLRPAGEANME